MSSPENTAAPGARVLIVDDSIDVCTATQRLLFLEGFQVRMAHDGGSAVKIAEAFRPNIVLLDLTLPDMDGFATLQALKQLPESRAARFIALSGRTDCDDFERSRRAGFECHLVKPVHIPELLELLHR